MSAPFVRNLPNRDPQIAVMLLAVLHDLKGARTKSQTIALIKDNGWFNFKPEDHKPFQWANASEPRWEALIGIARRICVDDGLISHDQVHDSWQITNKGVKWFSMLQRDYSSGDFDCTKCFMWSPVFKARMCPSYAPSDADVQRTGSVYADNLKKEMEDRYKIV